MFGQLFQQDKDIESKPNSHLISKDLNTTIASLAEE